MRHPSGLLPTYATRSVKSSEPPTPTDVASGTSCTSTSPGVHVSTLLLCGAAGTSARLSAGAAEAPAMPCTLTAPRTRLYTVNTASANTTASAEKNTMRRRRYRRLRSAAVMRFLPPVVRVVPRRGDCGELMLPVYRARSPLLSPTSCTTPYWSFLQPHITSISYGMSVILTGCHLCTCVSNVFDILEVSSAKTGLFRLLAGCAAAVKAASRRRRVTSRKNYRHPVTIEDIP